MISHSCPDMCFPNAFHVFIPVGRRGHSRVYSFTLFYSLSLVKRVKTVGISTVPFTLLHFFRVVYRSIPIRLPETQ